MHAAVCCKNMSWRPNLIPSSRNKMSHHLPVINKIAYFISLNRRVRKLVIAYVNEEPKTIRCCVHARMIRTRQECNHWYFPTALVVPYRFQHLATTNNFLIYSGIRMSFFLRCSPRTVHLLHTVSPFIGVDVPKDSALSDTDQWLTAPRRKWHSITPRCVFLEMQGRLSVRLSRR